jgi:segregation and condensation protein B
MEELEPQSAGESPVEALAPSESVSPEPASDTPEWQDEATAAPAEPAVSADELLATGETAVLEADAEEAHLKAVLEALVYVTEEPLTVAQISGALQLPEQRIGEVMDRLVADFERPDRGIHIKEVAGGYKMATKPEHHDAVRNFAKSLKPPLKLSLPALETLAVIAYKQPVTGPEIMEIRGVQGGGVMKTLLDRKLIAAAGRKNVIGKPILYKTTREFLLQFGLKDLSELPSLKEFEEIRRMAFSDEPAPAPEAAPPAEEPAVQPEAAEAESAAVEAEVAPDAPEAVPAEPLVEAGPAAEAGSAEPAAEAEPEAEAVSAEPAPAEPGAPAEELEA